MASIGSNKNWKSVSKVNPNIKTDPNDPLALKKVKMGDEIIKKYGLPREITEQIGGKRKTRSKVNRKHKEKVTDTVVRKKVKAGDKLIKKAGLPKDLK